MNEKTSDSSSDNLDENDTEYDSSDAPKGDSFRMYYALGPDIDQNSIMETVNSSKESLGPPEKDITDFSNYQSDITNIPPDVVTSAKKIRIITEEPRRLSINNVSFDNRDMPAHVHAHGQQNLVLDSVDSRDYTSMQRQMDAYKNLEDLLDVPWEESDLAPPNKVDVVLRVGGEIGERYNNM